MQIPYPSEQLCWERRIHPPCETMFSQEGVFASRIPKYISRSGSKCYFSYDPTFFNDNKPICLKLIAFYTLYLFGHQESSNDVLVSTASQFRKFTLNECLGLIAKNKLHNRVFHLPDPREKKLMAYFNGDALVTLFKRASEMRAMNTKDMVDHKSCKSDRIHNKYPSMYDKFNVKIYKTQHYYDCDKDVNHIEERDNTCLVVKRVSEYRRSLDPDYSGNCDLCDCHNNINVNDFTIDYNIKEEATDTSKSTYSIFKAQALHVRKMDNLKNIETHTSNVTMNNLIFNFRDFGFNLEISDNSCKITFDPKAIGGFKHASFSTGAMFEVHHAVPGSLQHYQTTYVNSIDIHYTLINDEIIITSVYKAIDVL